MPLPGFSSSDSLILVFLQASWQPGNLATRQPGIPALVINHKTSKRKKKIENYLTKCYSRARARALEEKTQRPKYILRCLGQVSLESSPLGLNVQHCRKYIGQNAEAELRPILHFGPFTFLPVSLAVGNAVSMRLLVCVCASQFGPLFYSVYKRNNDRILVFSTEHSTSTAAHFCTFSFHQKVQQQS